jgi:hypothetical protein
MQARKCEHGVIGPRAGLRAAFGKPVARGGARRIGISQEAHTDFAAAGTSDGTATAMRDAPRQPPRVQQRERGVARGSRVGMTFVIDDKSSNREHSSNSCRKARLAVVMRGLGD